MGINPIHSFGKGSPIEITNEGDRIMGTVGEATPLAVGTNASFKGLHFRFRSTATSGDVRGMYMRMYCATGAGGEAIRAFFTQESDTPGDTTNGLHSSLEFGSSAGNITGLGTASRHTLHVPNRSLGGTVAGLMSEFWGEGASSVIGGTASFLRCVFGGNGTFKTAAQSKIRLLDMTGVTIGSNGIVHTSSGTATHGINVLINGALYELLVKSL